MRRLVESLGHSVACTAENGAKVVEHASSGQIDLAIVDLEMPVLDGLAAAEELWTTRHIPVVLVSGHSDFSQIVREQEPVATYLAKPVFLESLKRAIDQALERGGPPVQNGHSS